MRGVIFWCIAAGCCLAGTAQASVPWTYDGSVPDDLTDKRVWMYAATPEAGSPLTGDARELHGVRGAHLLDADATAPQGFATSTGRPDVTIAVLDSGIKWNDDGAMADLRFTTRISRGEARKPVHDRSAATVEGADCATFAGDGWDVDGNGVFNLRDYACDTRVVPDPARGVNPDLLDPQDVLIAFTDGVDDDGNGHPDDMVGWDFLDDDNDPFDDVQYGHGTGEARDSTAEADNGGELGTCPNCQSMHLRVGTSFIADVNRFALATLYAVDNGALVVQEALGTLNKSRLGRDAVDYAWERGVTVIASAADEAAQHNNWPSSYPRVILVNSVTHTDSAPSYVSFNGCTNFNSKVDLAIPSVSCSSDATGRAAGMAGLVHAAALDARDAGRLSAHPSCRRVDGSACALSADEVKQLLIGAADDVNFAQTPTGVSLELSCRPVPTTLCLNPFTAAPTTRLLTDVPASYPARKGHDQFYGYGRVNMARTLSATADAKVPPEVEITSPQWYDAMDPGEPSFAVSGRVWARGAAYTCRVLVAPGGYPGEADFAAVDSDVCDGSTVRSAPLDGVLGAVDVAALKAAFPAATDFAGVEHGTVGQPWGGRPASDPYGVVVKVVATLTGASPATGQDRRKLFLHRDADQADVKQLPGDGEASPLLADLDGDDRNELVLANSDGVVHAWRRDGSELDGFPVRVGALPRQTGRAFTSGAVERAAGAVLASPAAGDLDRDGRLELVVADLEGHVSVISSRGELVRRMAQKPAWTGEPLTPFANVRQGKLHRVQRGFFGSPVLADLDGDGTLEIVAAAMDRHVYAWHADGSAVEGWPALVVDRSKVAAVDPVTDAVTFKDGAGADFDQGAIVSTPAVGDLDGDGRPEVVVGTNESYAVAEDGGLNAGGLDEAVYGALGVLLEQANARLFAFSASAEPVTGWPLKVGVLSAGILPMVGEGVTGSPAIGSVACGGLEPEPVVGTIPAAGLGYLVGADGASCLGRLGGRDRALPSAGAASLDQPFLAAFGHPAFGELTGGTAFLAPVAGLTRALDIVLPEYQGGRDQLAAWSPGTGALRPGWPAEVNDLQFLTGPSVGDVSAATPGEEVVAGTASMDLQAFDALGRDVPGWPKLTGDWTVANPTIGVWGDERVVIGLTRSGKVLAYASDADRCAPASWPRFHHDNANSGDARRDAVLPGRVRDAKLDGDRVTFTAPGDDGRCGEIARYEVRGGATVDAARAAGPAGRRSAGWAAVGVDAVAPGSGQAVPVPATGRFVAVRAVDDQGNVGREAVLDRGAPAGDAPRTDEPSPTPGAGTAAPGSAGAPASAPSRAGTCLPRTLRLTRRGLGPLRLGMRAPSRSSRTVMCVTGGGRVVVHARRNVVIAIASTAPGHRAGRLRVGARAARVRRLPPGLGARIRGGRVTAVVVADGGAQALRSAVRQAFG